MGGLFFGALPRNRTLGSSSELLLPDVILSLSIAIYSQRSVVVRVGNSSSNAAHIQKYMF